MEIFKRKFYTWTTSHGKLIVVTFIILAIISALMWRQVGVNYDMKDYLPEGTKSTVAIEVMSDEYEAGVPNARVMIEDITVTEALDYKEKILSIDGVDGVTWLDDSINVMIPLETADQNIVDQYYKDGNALFQLTIDKDEILTAVADIREIVGENAAMTGDAISTEVATVSTLKEIPLLCILAVAVVLLILLFATESWLEPVIILISLGIAILINAGTNLIFGEVSFVTNGSGNLLLLAVSLDYSVFLLHRFHQYRDEMDDPREAMVEALCKSTNAIASSGLTTVIGFLALVLMRFLLGPDLGLASAKGVIISLITVFVFLPPWLLMLYKWSEKTRHKSLMPDFTKLGKLVVKTMVPLVCVFALIIAPAFLASNANDYYYGASKIFGLDTKYGQDEEKIIDTFGENDNYALMVPKGDLAAEKALSKEILQLESVRSVISYVDTVGAEIPSEYLEESTLSQLNSENYTRMVINAEVPQEGEETYTLVEEIRGISEKYYGNDYHLAGSGVSYYDLMDTVSADMLKVNIVAVIAVYLILVLMMKSILLPVLLVLSIETAIWLNIAVPYFAGDTIFYISYLIISAIQLGATVDYAILMTDTYREQREILDKKDAIVQTIASSVPSILVSGLALTIVGTLMGKLSSHGILAMLGIFLGRGALFSMIIVIFVLPGLLYMFDKLFINRGKKKMNKNKAIASALAVILALTPAAAFADSNSGKEEVIYANLAHNGQVSDVYVVNIFDEENIVDYGEYTSVKNLTTNDEINTSDGKVTVTASETPFYYQGDLDNHDLPWNIEINYTLDGIPYDADDLAGKSGLLEISIDIYEGNNAFFYENYALQMNMSMDSTFCRNIQAEGATIANVGSDKQLTYTILPGKGADIHIKADVTGFEMSEITINGVKLNMEVDVDTSELENQAVELEEGAKQLDDGAQALDKGVSELKSCSEKLDYGATELNNGVTSLGSGADTLSEGINALEEGAGQLDQGIGELNSGLIALKDNVNSTAFKQMMIANGLDSDTLLEGNQLLIDQLTAIMTQAAGMMDPDQQALYTQVVTLLQGNNAFINGSFTYLDSVNEQLVNAQSGAQALDTAADDLTSGAAEMAEGSKTLISGITQLQTGSESLTNGTSELVEGSTTLKSGTSELTKGTSTLKSETAGIDEKITDEISKVKDGITGSDEIRSFISEKNTTVESVQFVMKTDAISIDEPEITEIKQEVEKSFWKKLLDLFR